MKTHHLAIAIAFAAITATLLAVQPALAQQKPNVADAYDQKLMSELAGRNMDGLLDYYARKNHVPREVLDAANISKFLAQLVAESFNKLKPAEKQKIIDGVVAGITKQVGTIKDPDYAMKIATALILSPSMQSLINTLEYWGENPHAQAQLHPMAAAVDSLLQKNLDLLKQQQDTLNSAATSGNDPRFAPGGLYEQLDNKIGLATYTLARSRYSLALSLDRASEERKKICDQAIEPLKDFDDPARGVQVAARGDLAKLNMLKGDSAEADRYFDLVIKEAVAPPGANAADVAAIREAQYQARYFKAVNALMAKQLDQAQKLSAELLAWQKENLPKDEAVQKGADAASAMLTYRILSAQMEEAPDAAAKQKLKAQSLTLLLDLMAKQPGLRSIIFGQLAANLPEDKDYKKWDLLLLEALLQKGVEAVNRETPEKDDAKWLDRASDAAREIVARKGQPGNTKDNVATAAVDLGLLKEKLASAAGITPEEQMVYNQDAVEAFLDFSEEFAADKARSTEALDQAEWLVIKVLRANPKWKEDDRTYKLYDRMLSIAVGRGKTELTYAYAQRLMTRQQWKVAAEQFAKVPRSEKAVVNVMARFYQMMCLQKRLVDTSEKLELIQKADIGGQVQTLADQVNSMVPAAEAAADAKVKGQLLQVRIQTMLIAADLARGGKNFQRVLDVLKDAESVMGELPEKDQQTLMGDVLQLRVNARMGLNKTEEAIADLRNLIKAKGKDAFNTISALASRVDEQYHEAVANHDEAMADQLADERAELAKLLVDLIKDDPKNPHRKEYLMFNAGAQVDDADRTKDDAKKQQCLKEATATYEELLKDDPNDAKLIFGKGNVYFAQKAWREAANTFGDLFVQKLLGKPIDIAVGIDGQPVEKPNKYYWAAFYKFMRSETELAKQNPDTEESKQLRSGVEQKMKQMIIEWGDDMGFDQKASLQTLREEVIPGWKPSTMPAAKPATKPATMPGK